jgi:hypothetical protein
VIVDSSTSANAVLDDRQPLFVERDGALAVRRGSLRGEVGIARGEQPAWAGLRRQCAVARLLDDVAFEWHRFSPVRGRPRLAWQAERLAELHAVETDACPLKQSNWVDRVTMGAPPHRT